jgi:hypothetical protein
MNKDSMRGDFITNFMLSIARFGISRELTPIEMNEMRIQTFFYLLHEEITYLDIDDAKIEEWQSEKEPRTMQKIYDMLKPSSPFMVSELGPENIFDCSHEKEEEEIEMEIAETEALEDDQQMSLSIFTEIEPLAIIEQPDFDIPPSPSYSFQPGSILHLDGVTSIEQLGILIIEHCKATGNSVTELCSWLQTKEKEKEREIASTALTEQPTTRITPGRKTTALKKPLEESEEVEKMRRRHEMKAMRRTRRKL